MEHSNILPFTAASPERMTGPDAVNSGAGTEAQRRITPLHRGAEMRFVDPAEVAWRERKAARAAVKPNLNDTFAESLQREPYRPSTFDRIANALGSRRMFDIYLGFYAGAMATVGFAYLWAVLS